MRAWQLQFGFRVWGNYGETGGWWCCQCKRSILSRASTEVATKEHDSDMIPCGLLIFQGLITRCSFEFPFFLTPVMYTVRDWESFSLKRIRLLSRHKCDAWMFIARTCWQMVNFFCLQDRGKAWSIIWLVCTLVLFWYTKSEWIKWMNVIQLNIHIHTYMYIYILIYIHIIDYRDDTIHMMEWNMVTTCWDSWSDRPGRPTKAKTGRRELLLMLLLLLLLLLSSFYRWHVLFYSSRSRCLVEKEPCGSCSRCSLWMSWSFTTRQMGKLWQTVPKLCTLYTSCPLRIHFPFARTKMHALNPDNFSDVCDQTGVTLNRYMIEVGFSGMKATSCKSIKSIKRIEFENHMNLWWFTRTALACIALHHAASRSWQANRQGVVDTDILSVTHSALTAFAFGVSCPFAEPPQGRIGGWRHLKTFFFMSLWWPGSRPSGRRWWTPFERFDWAALDTVILAVTRCYLYKWKYKVRIKAQCHIHTLDQHLDPYLMILYDTCVTKQRLLLIPAPGTDQGHYENTPTPYGSLWIGPYQIVDPHPDEKSMWCPLWWELNLGSVGRNIMNEFVKL